MDFTAMDARAYRGLNADQYEERRSLVLSLAEDLPEDATMEQIEAIDAEVAVIGAEQERRNKLAETRNQKAVEVAAGAGKVVGSTEAAKPQVRVKKDDSLGKRVWDQMQERGYTRGERFQVSNVAFRAATDPESVGQLNPSGTNPNYFDDLLTQVDPRIREGYRRPLTIWDLFNHEVTEKDAVAYYVEGAMEGGAGMTAELGAFSPLHVKEPERKVEPLKKVTAIWKQSDEILTDAPRFVTHVNSRAAYSLDTVIEDQLVSGAGTGENLTGLTNASGILTESSITAYDLSFIEDLLKKKTAIRKATPNFNVDTLLVADEDYDALQLLKNASDQYVLGGPTGVVYGNQPTIGDVLWRTIRIVPTPALSHGTSVLGAFKLGATVYEHVTGRRFDTGYDGDDFSRGRVSFRAYQRLALAVEYPGAFCKYTVGS